MKDHRVHRLLMLEIHCEIQIVTIIELLYHLLYSNHILLM